MIWKDDYLKTMLSKELARKEPSPLVLDYYTGKITYEDYLASPHWKEVKTQRLALAGYCCDVCGDDEIQLQVHHKNYETLGHETMDDLAVLCPYCHKDVHKEITRLRGKEFMQRIHVLAAEYFVPNLMKRQVKKITADAKRNNVKGTPVIQRTQKVVKKKPKYKKKRRKK